MAGNSRFSLIVRGKTSIDNINEKVIHMEESEQQKIIEGTPFWDNIGGEQLPFFNPTEERKWRGIRVKFLSDAPRKQTENRFDPKNPKPELWFDVEVMGNPMTWTISQVSLLVELKNNAPLSGKTFDIQLVAVDEEFKKQNPKYKGRTRYKITEVNAAENPVEELVK